MFLPVVCVRLELRVVTYPTAIGTTIVQGEVERAICVLPGREFHPSPAGRGIQRGTGLLHD